MGVGRDFEEALIPIAVIGIFAYVAISMIPELKKLLDKSVEKGTEKGTEGAVNTSLSAANGAVKGVGNAIDSAFGVQGIGENLRPPTNGVVSSWIDSSFNPVPESAKILTFVYNLFHPKNPITADANATPNPYSQSPSDLGAPMDASLLHFTQQDFGVR